MLVEHCRGITLLLSDGLIYSARTLNRTAYETSMHLMYLATVGDKYENARLYETYMLLEAIERLASTGPMAETRKTLAAVPVDIRERVETIRKNTRLQWCGKTRAQMATALRIVQHQGVFSVLSWPTHGLSGGEDMLRIDGGPDEGMTFWRHPPSTEDIEDIVSHVRRAVLRPTYYLATLDFYGNPPPPLPTPKPERGNY
jgi:hypothetical protein